LFNTPVPKRSSLWFLPHVIRPTPQLHNMATALSYAPDMQFDSLVPNSSDEASSDSISSPIDFSQFPDTFLNDLSAPGQLNFEMEFEPGFEVPDISYVHPNYCAPVKMEPSMLLEPGVLASLEALKAADAEKGYTVKPHAPTKKMRGDRQEDERVVRRRTKNREAAQASRLRKRMRLDTLENLVAEQKAITHAIMVERDNMMRENMALRSEVEYLKQALRVSMDGLKGLEADQLFSNVELGI